MEPIYDDGDSRWQLASWKMYVFHRGDGKRLYVGRTSQSYEERWAQHQVHPRNKYWYEEIDHSQTKTWTIGYTFGWQAARHEKREIKRNGGTLANIQHNQGRGKVYVDGLIAARSGVYIPQLREYEPAPGELLLADIVELFPYFVLAMVPILAASLLFIISAIN